MTDGVDFAGPLRKVDDSGKVALGGLELGKALLDQRVQRVERIPFGAQLSYQRVNICWK